MINEAISKTLNEVGFKTSYKWLKYDEKIELFKLLFSIEFMEEMGSDYYELIAALEDARSFLEKHFMNPEYIEKEICLYADAINYSEDLMSCYGGW